MGLALICIISVTAILSSGKKGFSKKNKNKCVAFPTQSYLEGDALWSNADYVIEGTFQNILLKDKKSDSTLCSIITADKKIQLPIIFKDSLMETPLQKEQKIKVLVNVEEDGRIIAGDCIAQ